jgi:hypothetical protein
MTATRESVRSRPANSATADPCSTKIDPKAPAGSENSLGAKSDCNGRPSTDDEVLEAMDEAGPLTTPPAAKNPARKA